MSNCNMLENTCGMYTSVECLTGYHSYQLIVSRKVCAPRELISEQLEDIVEYFTLTMSMDHKGQPQSYGS